MPTASNKGGADYELMPEGLTIGVCYAVIDLGTHHDEKFDKDKNEVCLIWELPNIEPIMIDGEPKPRVISKRYTLSLNERANLRNDLESWRGKAFTEEQLDVFDLKVLIGVNCQIQIIHNKKGTKTYANIKTIVPAPEGHVTIKPVAPTVVYDIGNQIPDDVIPDWLCQIIRDAKEWDETTGASSRAKQGSEVPEEETTQEPF